MTTQNELDLLRDSNFLQIDKRSEAIATRHFCGTHYHRCYVLEGVRRAALRNLKSLHNRNSQSIIEPGTAYLYSTRYDASVELILEDLNQICGEMYRIFIHSLWDVYLCLLHEEILAYNKLAASNFNFQYAPLSKFLDSNLDFFAHLRTFRNRVLHPTNPISMDDAVDRLLSSADERHSPFPKLITDVQFLLDAHTVRFWYSMASHFVTEGDKEIQNKSLESGQFGRIEKLNRMAKGICQTPLPHWPNSSDLHGDSSQIHFFALSVIRNSKSHISSDCSERRNLYPCNLRKAKQGCIQMLMRALAFFNEFTASWDVEKMLAWPVNPSTDPSVRSGQFFHSDRAPRTTQEHEDREALLRVTLALLYEPLRLYREVTESIPGLRLREIDDFVYEEAKFESLKTARKSVFHVPLDHVDVEVRRVQVNPIAHSLLDLLGPIMNFYNECPDPP